MLGRLIDKVMARFSKGPEALDEIERKLDKEHGHDIVEPPIDLADPQYTEPYSTSLELVDFAGASSDVAWMTFNHDTGEVIIQYLEHGKAARLYSYPRLPYEEFEALVTGVGVYPAWRNPRYYQKAQSTGQRVNYYLRNDQRDDLYEYERLS